jgi:hypothetical protein
VRRQDPITLYETGSNFSLRVYRDTLQSTFSVRFSLSQNANVICYYLDTSADRTTAEVTNRRLDMYIYTRISALSFSFSSSFFPVEQMIMGVCRRFSLSLSLSLCFHPVRVPIPMRFFPNHSSREKSINRENVSLVREHIVVVVLRRKYF